MSEPLFSGQSVSDAVISRPFDSNHAVVYVIDDESEVRRSLTFLMSSIGLTGWPFASAADFLDSLSSLKSAPILLDIRMPETDGIQLMARLNERGINWPVIVMTAHGDIPVAVRAIKLGALEFLEKPLDIEAMKKALHDAFDKLSLVDEIVAIREGAIRRFALLSPRERQIIDVLTLGRSNKAAAHILSLSVRTIEMHRANALAKLGVKSVVEVAELAVTANVTRNAPVVKPDDSSS